MPRAEKDRGQAASKQPQTAPVSQREPDGLYQFDYYGTKQLLVGRVLDAEVDEGTKEVRFGEIYRSDDLSLADECEFQKYRIRIRKVGYASKIDKEAPHKGRVLRDVTGELLGYSEQ